jgi:TPP-dependent pyruvate/acetoin dehydrogenase alpha subunit
MDFVDQKNNRDAVDFMEDAALDNNIIDEDEFDKMMDSYQDYYEDEAIDVAEEFLDDDYVSIYDDDYVSEEEIEFYDEEERIRQQQEEEQQMAYAAMVFAVDPNEFG